MQTWYVQVLSQAEHSVGFWNVAATDLRLSGALIVIVKAIHPFVWLSENTG